MRIITFCFLLWIASHPMFAQDKEFKFSDRLTEKQIDVLYNGKLLTSYYYVDSIKKPILFPINTISGITLTRGYPIAPRQGERMDHPPQVGMWLNYESVNGIDFWNASTFVPFKDRSRYGSIVHDGIVKTDADKDKAILEVTARWINYDQQILIRESTQYRFTVKGNDFIIDRSTTLMALDEEINFKDAKEGLLGIRVARELEHPSAEPGFFFDNTGNGTTPDAIVKDDSLSGEYISSEGLTGNAVWGTRGAWVSLHGLKDNKKVSITIIDHPHNMGYPTHWHTRDYGLFAANPFGKEIFTKGKEKLNLILKKGEVLTLKYRVIIHEGIEFSVPEIELLAKDFGEN